MAVDVLSFKQLEALQDRLWMEVEPLEDSDIQKIKTHARNIMKGVDSSLPVSYSENPQEQRLFLLAFYAAVLSEALSYHLAFEQMIQKLQDKKNPPSPSLQVLSMMAIMGFIIGIILEITKNDLVGMALCSIVTVFLILLLIQVIQNKPTTEERAVHIASLCTLNREIKTHRNMECANMLDHLEVAYSKAPLFYSRLRLLQQACADKALFLLAFPQRDIEKEYILQVLNVEPVGEPVVAAPQLAR
ncbi:MAG TPA: hypothetical protein VJB02_06800 [Coxiellaceae bacterium]|nr:hypothetical protein [Coxiellaceae bacterium]